MMALSTPVLTKWQDLLADQHPVPSLAIPYIRTHSRTLSTYTCMFTLDTSHYNLVYMWPAITRGTLNSFVAQGDRSSSWYFTACCSSHSLTLYVLCCAPMLHRFPMSTWYGQLVGSEWPFFGAGQVILPVCAILRHFLEWWFACARRTAGRRWSQQPRRATLRW